MAICFQFTKEHTLKKESKLIRAEQVDMEKATWWLFFQFLFPIIRFKYIQREAKKTEREKSRDMHSRGRIKQVGGE